MKEIAAMIDLELEKKNGHRVGFALLSFEFDNPGIGCYISNADREDMIKALREVANRIEEGRVIPPTIGGMQ